MKVPRKAKKEVEIPQASLSDISFLLLVFFLSTTTFDVKKGLGIMLPKLSSKENTTRVRLDDKNLAKIVINENGKIALDKKEISVTELEKNIRKRVRENPDLVISLRTNRKSNYENMIEVLDHLRMADAKKISLSTN